MLSQIEDLLTDKGYSRLSEDNSGILYRECPDIIYVVTLSDTGRKVDSSVYTEFERKLEFTFTMRFRKKVEVLHIILVEDGMFEHFELQMLERMSNIWVVAKDTGKTYVFERQISDFDNLYDFFDNKLPDMVNNKKQKSFVVTPVNIGIVILNVLCFFAVIIRNGGIYAVYDSEIMLHSGALSYETFSAGAWYQIITSFFLHFGFSHLLNNMVLLTYVGCELERRIGGLAYLAIYFISGIIGNVVSLWYYSNQKEQVVSAGASGAIFGVIGALFVLLLVCQIKSANLSPFRLLIMTGLTIYYGITSAGIDNAAHIGGLLAGIIGGFLLSKISRYGKLE